MGLKMVVLGTCYTIIWCHKLSKVRSVFENDILLTYIIHQNLISIWSQMASKSDLFWSSGPLTMLRLELETCQGF